MNIAKMHGREIFDCRGFPALECQLVLDDGRSVVASVPSGIMSIDHEAKEKRDNAKRMKGNGVLNSIESLEKIIAPSLIGNEPDVVELDQMMIELDGTEDKSNLGASAMLAASYAVARAQATVQEMELYEFIASLCTSETVKMPFPVVTFVSGGPFFNNGLTFQEFLIIPVAAQYYREAIEQTAELFHIFGDILLENSIAPIIGLEGGYVSQFNSDLQVLDLMVKAIERYGDTSAFKIGLDIGAINFYDRKSKKYTWNGKNIDSTALIDEYKKLTSEYSIVSLEDGLVADDWKAWEVMTEAFDENVQIAGDSLFVTNPGRIWYAAHHNAANAVMIKPNQIGTLTETIQAIELCTEHSFNIIVSHQLAETNDTFVADLAVGASAQQIKAGGCARGERTSKYNRLLQIEDDLVRSMLED